MSPVETDFSIEAKNRSIQRRALQSVLLPLPLWGAYFGISTVIKFPELILLLGLLVVGIGILCIVTSFIAMEICYYRSPDKSAGARRKILWRRYGILGIALVEALLVWKTTPHIWENMCLYTIKIINQSDQPLEAVRFESYYGDGKNVVGTIPAGKLAKVKWDARDENGVELHLTWKGQQYYYVVVGYTLWEDPENYRIIVGPDGRLTSNGKEVKPSEQEKEKHPA